MRQPKKKLTPIPDFPYAQMEQQRKELTPIPGELLLGLLSNQVDICELLAIIQCKTQMGAVCGYLAADYKTESKLCIYKTYDKWKMLEEGDKKESVRRLLLKNKDFYPYREFLLDAKPFDPFDLELPSELISKNRVLICSSDPIFCWWGFSNSLWLWPLFYGESITKAAINLVIEHAQISDFSNYRRLAVGAANGGMDPRLFRQLIVTVTPKMGTTAGQYSNQLKTVLEEESYYRTEISQQFLYAADEMGFRYTALPSTSPRALRLFKLNDYDLSTTFLSVYRDKDIFQTCADHIGAQRFQCILSHQPAAWCTTAEIFQKVVDLASDEHNLLAFLRKLPDSVKFTCGNTWLSATVKRLFDAHFSEGIFAQLMRLLDGPVLSVDVVQPIVSSFMFEKSWDMKLLLRIFKCTPNLSLQLKYFKRLAEHLDEEYVLSLAMFAKKNIALLYELVEMGLQSSFICLLIRLHICEFADDPVTSDDVENLIEVALNYGFSNEDGLFDLFEEYLTVPKLVAPPIIADPTTESLFKICSAHFSSISLAIQHIPKKQIVDLIMYDPDQWWHGPGVVDFVSKALNAADLSKFLGRLRRRSGTELASDAMEIMWPFIEQDHTILSKLLYVFPKTVIDSAFIYKHTDSFVALPHHLKVLITLENPKLVFQFCGHLKIPPHFVMGYALRISEEPGMLIEYLKQCEVPSSFVKMYHLWHGIEAPEPVIAHLNSNSNPLIRAET